MIITRTDVLSGATPQQIQDHTAGLAPASLAGLAARLAEDPGLRVSVITYDDGSKALEVLRAGPPGHTEHTIDRRRFTRPDGSPARTLPLAGQSGLQDAIRLIRATLQDADQPPGR